MSSILGKETIEGRIQEIILAPINQPDLIPTLLPLILGWIIIELYFGKHKNEELGWNTSVGNSILWIATGLNLVITENIDSTLEMYVAYFLVGAGLIVGYMNFFHKWSSSIAYSVSSADVIYPLAYVTVVIVKTDIPVTETVLQAGGLFIIGSIIVFRLIRMMEAPARDNYFG